MTEVLYIGGASRSGTTLVERLLGLLPEFQTLGEVRHLWARGVLDDELCGCGAPFGQCPFWAEVGDRALGGWDRGHARWMVEVQDRCDRSRRIPRLIRDLRSGGVSPTIQRYAQVYGHVYTAASAVSGRSMVIDSSKHVSQPFVLQADPDLNVRVLQIVRDPRGVAYSWSKEVVRPEIIGQSQLMDQLSARHVALDWDVQNGLFDLLRLVRIPRLILGYEELLADPVSAMGRIAAFCGATLPGELAVDLARREVTLPPQHSAAGNPMRFRSGQIRLRRDEGWRAGLSGRDRLTVECATAPLRFRYRSAALSSHTGDHR